jgi:anaerobic selenocysteine-containing dehydrogenase
MTVIYGNRSVDTRDTIRQSKCILCWGNNPAETSSTYWKFHAEAKEAGAKIIVIDPRYSTSASLADQWIPLKPGTDSLFAIGMLRYIFSERFADIDEYFLKHRTNAAYLIDLTSAEEDDGTPVSLTTLAQRPWNKIQNLKYYLDPVSNEPTVYDIVSSSIVPAEPNTGKNGTPMQNPDLYYYSPATPNVITAYELMRALYAGDLLVSSVPGRQSITPGFENLHDPTYDEVYIVSTTGIEDIQVLKDCADAYVGSGKKSMIIQNMGGGGRVENGGSHFALQCILSVITGNIGDPGNGVCDTAGYGAPQGFQTGDPARIGTGSNYATVPPPAGPTYAVPFGVLGDRMRAANNGTPQTSFVDPTSAVVDAPIKFWYSATLNLLTQYPNTDALKEALCSTETVVVAKPTWNTDADYSDYYLPVTTPFEYVDLGAANRNKYVHVMEAGVRPYGSALSDAQIIRELAKVVFDDDPAVAAQFEHDDEFYVESIINNPANNFASNGIAGYDALKELKSVRPTSIPRPWVPHRNHEFLGTRAINGRAKLFITEWQSPATYPFPRLSSNPAKVLYRGPFPRYVPAMESQLPLLPDFTALPVAYQSYRDEYKLACVQFKNLRSVHASFTGLPWIREAFGEKGIVLIHKDDALERGIYDGDVVTVRSHTGKVERIARVTTLIMKGVTAIENSLWDKYGPKSSSTVGAERPDPMGCGHTHNNTLVEVERGGLS